MRIENEYNKTGYFWLPGGEDKKVPGVLSIEDGGRIELETLGLLEDSPNDKGDDDIIERIIGFVEKDGLVTLDNCFYITKSLSFGDISKSKILVNRAFTGIACDKNEALNFNTFSFEVDCLDEWVGISGIRVEHDWENKTAVINYDPPKKINIILDNGMSLEICFAYTLPGFPNLKEAKFTQRAFFRLVSKELRDLNEFTTVAYKINNLMCFAMDEVVVIKNVSATSEKMQRSGGNNKEYPIKIKIYYQSNMYSEKLPNRNLHNILFNYNMIKDNFQQVFNSWINAYEYLSPAFSLYFSTKIGAQKYLDGKFLALAQGLETYHRRTSDEKIMDPEAFEKLVSSIIDYCPEENIEWLRGRLMHGNEINLGKRLKSIIEPFKEHLGSSRERNKLLRKIVDTRNYLTHYSNDLEDESAKGRDLWVICMKMEAIFVLHFLNVVGFTQEEIKKVINNCYPMQQKLNPC